MATSPITKTHSYRTLHKKPVARSGKSSWSVGYNLLDESQFLHLLRLERKRAERSTKPFMLMLIGCGQLFGGSSARLVGQVTSSLTCSARETDTLGWYQDESIMGVIFTEIGSDASNTPVIIAKITAALQQSLSIEEFKALEISFRVFPEDDQPKPEPDFTFYPDFSERHDTRTGARYLKRSLDIIGSLGALLILCPVFAVVALLVKLTSEGPVLFRQKRVGQHGTVFAFLKFRSMYANNDPKIHQEYVAKLIAGGANASQEGKANVFKLTNDPRITPLGRFLRRTSLDEIPQFLNVLKGEMSLVGPRPPVPYEFERYDIWHRRRVLEVKPGITGMWQVMGRSKTTFDEMVRLDLNYARVWSIWLDVKILLQTPKAVLSGDGAY